MIVFCIQMVYPDHSQNLMGSKLDQDPSSYFIFYEHWTRSICSIQLIYKQTNEHTDRMVMKKTSLAEVIMVEMTSH